jgi:hypothetical protein
MLCRRCPAASNVLEIRACGIVPCRRSTKKTVGETLIWTSRWAIVFIGGPVAVSGTLETGDRQRRDGASLVAVIGWLPSCWAGSRPRMLQAGAPESRLPLERKAQPVSGGAFLPHVRRWGGSSRVEDDSKLFQMYKDRNIVSVAAKKATNLKCCSSPERVKPL